MICLNFLKFQEIQIVKHYVVANHATQNFTSYDSLEPQTQHFRCPFKVRLFSDEHVHVRLMFEK